MMFLNWLRSKICYPDMPEPQGLSFIESFEITTILQAAFPNANIYIGDHKFKTTTKEELMRFLKYDLTDTNTYVGDYYDCVDYSFALNGSLSNPKWGALSFGIIWTDTDYNSDRVVIARHALNFFIDADREIWMVEPQRDRIFKMPKKWKPYLLITG